MRSPDQTVYDLAGPPSGPPVVLIHGLGLNRGLWAGQVPALSDRYRVLSYDILGHGQTPAPQGTPTLAMLADQVAGLMNHCGMARASVVGFSLGGMIARRFAQDHPARVRALAILHSPHRRTPQAQAAVEARVTEALSDGPGATVEAALERWFSDAYRQAHPEVMDRVRGWVLANDRKTYPLFYRVFATAVDEVIAPQPPLSCPTLVVTGDQDHGNGPEMAHAIAAEIAGAETLILPGLRHMAMMEDQGSTNRALRAFLDRVHKDD